MKLSLLFEPLINYLICLRNDSSIADNDISKVRKEVFTYISNIENKVKILDIKVNNLYKEMELPLLFFIDYMIASSKSSVAEEWDKNRLAFARSVMTGDMKFFDILEEIYSRNNSQYDECLEVFYLFLALGFRGYYESNPERIENIMYRISNRVPEIHLSQTDKILCRKNYDRICLDRLLKTGFLSFKMIFLFLLILFLSAYLINLFIFYKTSEPLFSRFNEIKDNTQYQGTVDR